MRTALHFLRNWTIHLLVCIPIFNLRMSHGSTIPIIDMSNFFNGSTEERRHIASEIGKACEDVGFFIIKRPDHIDKKVIENAWRTTANFFDMEVQYKSEYERPQEEYPFGYSRLGGEVLSSGKSAEKSTSQSKLTALAPDLKEMFSLGPGNPEAGFPARVFPDNPLEFEEAWTIYYETLAELAKEILRAFAITLNLPDENYFEAFVGHHASAMRALNYPHLEAPPLPNQLRASAHTDYGTITILRSDGPGLQVSKDKDPPSWIDVPYIEDGFVVNLGDLMARWTNDRWLSTLHRVVNPPSIMESGNCAEALHDHHTSSDVKADQGQPFDDAVDAAGNRTCNTRESTRRQSIAFFYNLDKDAVVSALPTTELGPSKYEPIVAGDFLMMKHLASIKASTEAASK